MKIAVLDPASGIAGDMFIGALIDVGLDRAWLERLPATLGLAGVGVRITDVQRSAVHCMKVDFDIPPQPHGRAVSEIHRLIDAVKIPEKVARLAHQAFESIATIEAAVHGVAPDELHLHEVGAVDAILDVIGSIWGVDQLGIDRIYNTRISLGDGTVKTAHGILPVPAPATIRLLEGFNVRHGPPSSGELTTPTGAALVRVLSRHLMNTLRGAADTERVLATSKVSSTLCASSSATRRPNITIIIITIVSTCTPSICTCLAPTSTTCLRRSWLEPPMSSAPRARSTSCCCTPR